MNGLVVFPTFFNLSLNLAIRCSSSEPQSAPRLVFADCIELPHFCLKGYNEFDFSIDHLVMSMCRVFSCVVGRGCLPCILLAVCSLGKTLLAFELLHFVLQGQTFLLLQVFLTFYTSFSWGWSWSLPPVQCHKLLSIVLQALYQIQSLESICHFHCIIIRDLI